MQNELIEEISSELEKRLHDLATFSNGNEGVTRLPFTPAARGAVTYLKNYMAEVGLEAYEDASGAVIGTLVGKSPETVVIGSHYDTVKQGGRFDGIAGVVCGIEIVRLLRKNALELPFTLQIVGTNDEEGVRFDDGFFSAKAFLGQWTVEGLKESCDKDGISIYAAMKEYGLDPEKISEATWDMNKIKAFIEIHIEQGPVLEAQKKELGIVTGIVGLRRYKLTVKGRADHAGTTPMNMRQDALLGAAAMITAVSELSKNLENAVSTVGSCQVLPNTSNTVAAKTILSVDIRSMKEEHLIAMEAKLTEVIAQITKKYDLQCEVQNVLQIEPLHMDEKLQKIIAESAQDRAYSTMHLHSGAGHDSLPIGRVVPAAMLFVPSENGRSHSPKEKTEVQDLAKAVVTIYDALQRMEEV